MNWVNLIQAALHEYRPKTNNRKQKQEYNHSQKQKRVREQTERLLLRTERSSEMLENSSLAFFEIHKLPTFKLFTFVRAFSILSHSLSLVSTVVVVVVASKQR